jgi:hypothetical protein
MYIGRPGTDVMIFKIFSPKHLAKILAFFAHIAATFCKNLIITLVFEKNANFFAENWQKSQKIVIITSAPDEFVKKLTEMKPNPFLSILKPLYITFALEKRSEKICAKIYLST